MSGRCATALRGIVITLITASTACGEPEATVLDAAPSLPEVDAPAAPSPDAPTVVVPSCAGPFTFSRSESDATTALETLLADVRTRSPAAYYRERLDGTLAGAQLTSIDAALDVPAGTDPRDAAIAWLAAASPATFRADEWRVDPSEPALDPDATDLGSRMIRTAVEDLPWPGTYPARFVYDAALYLFLERGPAGWTLRFANLGPTTVLATRADALLLAACTPPLPPPDAVIRATPVTGLEFVGCAESGGYTYTPHVADVITARADLGWQLDATVETNGHRRWRPTTTVTLEIDPSHYWPTINRADCTCGDQAGFTYRVDALTGGIQGVTPGINCVVC